ncbi:MAG: ABC transporter permease, partial [Lactobacillales bacterium]|nr:ABC transporter permease [Lactobacillales bacterium]
MKNKKIAWGNIYLMLVFLLLYLPIFYLLFYAFNQDGTMNNFTGITFNYFQKLFADSRLLLIVCKTFLLAFLSALIATLIGVFGAMGIYYVRKQHNKKTFLGLNNVLLVSSDVIIGASFLILFTFLGFKLGFVSVLLSHVAFSIPIVVLMI